MRPQFSLRTLFAFTALLSLICTWIVLPTLKANRFLSVLAVKDYERADHFLKPGDRFLARSADKLWAFEASGQLAPLSAAQVIRGKRTIVIRLHNFEHDQTAVRIVTISASSLGLGAPLISPVSYSGRFIDSRGTPEMRR